MGQDPPFEVSIPVERRQDARVYVERPTGLQPSLPTGPSCYNNELMSRMSSTMSVVAHCSLYGGSFLVQKLDKIKMVSISILIKVSNTISKD